MSLETLLKAAKYLELQEQQLNSNTPTGIRPPTISSPSASSSSSTSSSSSSSDVAYHISNSRNNFVNSSSNSNNNNHHNSNSVSSSSNRSSNNNNNNSTNINNNINNQNNSSNSNNSSSRSNHRNRHNYNNSEYHRRNGGRSIATITSSPPISPVNSTTNSSLLVNGGGLLSSQSNAGSGNVTMGPSSTSSLSSSAVMSLIGGTTVHGNNNSSHSLGESVGSSYEYHSKRHRQDYKKRGSTDGRSSEEPCKNGEHPITSTSSYLLISGGNETVSSTTISATTPLSKRDNKVTGSCDDPPHLNNSCKKVLINGNKCLSPNDQLLSSLHSTSSSSSAFNAGYPSSSSSSRLQVIPSSRSPLSPYAPPPSKIKKPTPLTPPPTSSRKLVEITRTRSSSLSSTNFAANVGNSGASLVSSVAAGGLSIAAVATTTIPSVSDGITLTHNRMAPIGSSGNGHVLANSGTEDSSQSSLNLSTSGYLSGGSANSSVGVSSSLSNLNISNSSTSSHTSAGHGNLNGFGPNDHRPHSTTGRRRTTSTNSGGGKQRSPCILRAGTREVHNKLEKHRRAHLKECFEQLKVQLKMPEEEKKKTSNLAILRDAYKYVMNLKKKERDLEQQVEQLAKEKINYQKRILNLKRELAAKHDNFDFPSIMSEIDNAMVQGERDNLSDTLSSTRGSARYSSSSSLSSATTVPSPSGSGSGSVVHNMSPHDTSPPTALAATSSRFNTSSPSSYHHTSYHHQQLQKSISPNSSIGHSVPLSLTTKSLQQRGSPTPSSPSPSSSSVNGIPPSSPNVSSSASPSSTSTSSLCASPPTIIPQSPLGAYGPSSNISTPVPISLKITNLTNGVKVPQSGSIISSSSSQYIPPSSSPLSSASNLSIIASTTNNSHGLTLTAVTSSATSSPSMLNYTSNENNSILSSASLSTANTINSCMPLNLNASASPSHLQFLHATAKDLSGKNGICRKPNDLHEQQSISTSLVAGPQTHHTFSSASLASAPEIILTSNASTTTTIATKDKMSTEDADQPKFINVLNGLQGNTMGLVLSQIPMFATSPQSLRMLGTGGLATIELSTSQVQPQSRNHSISSPTSTATATTGAQLHKLLVSGTTVSTSSGPSVTNCIGGNGSGVIGGGNVSSSSIAATTVSSELARLPGGAEVNLLSRNGKMTIVNNGITLKGADGTNGRAAMHVVAPLQTGGTSISRLAPLVVSQGKVANNLAAHLIPSSQLTRQVNLSVGGQLPIISTPYLTSPMVVAVASNQTQPTLSSVPPTATSVAVATATANGSVS